MEWNYCVLEMYGWHYFESLCQSVVFIHKMKKARKGRSDAKYTLFKFPVNGNPDGWENYAPVWMGDEPEKFWIIDSDMLTGFEFPYLVKR